MIAGFPSVTIANFSRLRGSRPIGPSIVPRGFARYTADQTDVLALDAPSLHRCAELAQTLFLLGDYEQTGGVTVEPVHEPGAQRVAGERTFDVREHGVDQRTALGAVRRMRDHSGRLVDYQQIGVFVDDTELDPFGERNERRRLRDHVLDGVARFKNTARLGRLAVDANAALPGAPRDLRPWGAR